MKIIQLFQPGKLVFDNHFNDKLIEYFLSLKNKKVLQLADPNIDSVIGIVLPEL